MPRVSIDELGEALKLVSGEKQVDVLDSFMSTSTQSKVIVEREPQLRKCL